jgi:hypothetical protein
VSGDVKAGDRAIVSEQRGSVDRRLLLIPRL